MKQNSLLNPCNSLASLKNHKDLYYYSLNALEDQNLGKISRLPISIRIMLESLLRNFDGHLIKEDDIKRLLNWNPRQPSGDVPFVVSRVILQDFTGVPLVVDLASMRDAVAKQGFNPSLIEPKVPVDLVVDHSVQVDRSGTNDAFHFNLKIEFERNSERYEFLKWGQDSFKTFQVIPPGIGIVHQINIEYIATVVSTQKKGGVTICFPDTLVGTDSHTTMVNGLGVLGWGVGGIEAEAAMLGQPFFMQMPEVIGVHLKGALNEGITATDLTLRITELLRNEKVVGKLVEFFGEGAASLSVADRATIGNMAPEYGATTGFFPVDERTLEYLLQTGRSKDHIKLVKDYLVEQKMFGIPLKGQVDYTRELELDLSSIKTCVSGPKRPQDRINLPDVKEKFHELLFSQIADGGYGKPPEEPIPKICVHPEGTFSIHKHHITGGVMFADRRHFSGWSEEEMVTNRPLTDTVISPGYSDSNGGGPAECEMLLSHGSIVIAAITSCTNTSNPSVMIAAGLLAKKAIEKGLKVNRLIKTSLAPGSRVVTDYLNKTGLHQYLDQLGFQLVAYGCTTCIGNSGPLDERIEKAIKEHDLITVSVLSGNRNFEARIHASVKANFLMSPPLVVAYALAGNINVNLDTEPLGFNPEGVPVYLKDVWPSDEEIRETISRNIDPLMFHKRYEHIRNDNEVWNHIKVLKSSQYQWDEKSSYIQQPPYFENFQLKINPEKITQKMRVLALFGDSISTDHISPAGGFRADTPAGKYLLSLGIPERDFNSYGSRRGNHLVMMRGTFANVRIRNHLAKGKEGGFTQLLPEGEIKTIFEACEVYHNRNVPLIVFAGKDYGMGSSRDWAAKGTALLGVKVVVARSFERIHRNNLVGMGVLPLEFEEDQDWKSLGITGEEEFVLEGTENELSVGMKVRLVMIPFHGPHREISLKARLDTPIELDYYKHGGIMPYVLRQILEKEKSVKN